MIYGRIFDRLQIFSSKTSQNRFRVLHIVLSNKMPPNILNAFAYQGKWNVLIAAICSVTFFPHFRITNSVNFNMWNLFLHVNTICINYSKGSSSCYKKNRRWVSQSEKHVSLNHIIPYNRRQFSFWLKSDSHRTNQNYFPRRGSHEQ